MRRKRIALIPAYEPDETLIELLKSLSIAGFETVLIDDGSSQRYQNLFSRSRNLAAVLSHPVNKGKGAALKTGFTYIKEHFIEDFIIVTLDADGQHTVSDAIKICDESEKYPNALILGNRKLNGKMPLRSRFGNWVTRWVYRLSTGLKVHDTQTGLRALGNELLPIISTIEGERYEYEMNVLLDFARRKIPIKEVDIEIIYINNNTSSHFDTLRDSARIYRDIIKFSASSLISFLIDYAVYSFVSVLTAGLTTTISLWISNISARIVSSYVNFTINRRLVFKAQDKLLRSAIQYFLLAAIILAGNTLVLNLLVKIFGLNRYISKLLTEILFFSLSFFVQRFIIFRKRSDQNA